MEEIKLGKYRHFKGDIMEVIGIAKNSEAPDDEYVVYRHVAGERAGEKNYWIRPIKMWNERIVRNGYDGPRFIPLETRPD